MTSCWVMLPLQGHNKQAVFLITVCVRLISTWYIVICLMARWLGSCGGLLGTSGPSRTLNYNKFLCHFESRCRPDLAQLIQRWASGLHSPFFLHPIIKSTNNSPPAATVSGLMWSVTATFTSSSPPPTSCYWSPHRWSLKKLNVNIIIIIIIVSLADVSDQHIPLHLSMNCFN